MCQSASQPRTSRHKMSQACQEWLSSTHFCCWGRAGGTLSGNKNLFEKVRRVHWLCIRAFYKKEGSPVSELRTVNYSGFRGPWIRKSQTPLKWGSLCVKLSSVSYHICSTSYHMQEKQRVLFLPRVTSPLTPIGSHCNPVDPNLCKVQLFTPLWHR